MTDTNEKKIGGVGRIFLRCLGFQLEVEAEGHIRSKKTAGQSSDQAVIQDQSNIIEVEIVEDVDPAEIEDLEEL